MERRNPPTGKGKAPSKMQQSSGEAGPQFQPPYKKLLSENASLKEQMRAKEQSWENRFSAREQQFRAHLKTLQEDCERKVNQVILEKDNLIAKMISDKQCLDVESVESLARLKQKEEDLEKSRAEWNIKHKALEDLLNSELAEQDKKYIEDMDQSRKLSQMEDQLQLLKQKNADLQDSNNKMSQVIKDKDALIKKVTDEKEALLKKNLECSAKLKKKEEALTLQSKPHNKALEQKTKSEQPAKEKGYKLADPIIFQKDLIASLNAKIKALQEENLQSRNEWETKVKSLEAQLGGEPSTKAVAIQSKPDNKALEQKTKSEKRAKDKGFKLADPIIVRKDNLIASLNFKIKALQEENMELLDRLDKKEEESLQSRNEWETKVKALEAQLGGEPSTKAVAIQSKPNNKALEQKTKSEQPAKDKGYQLANPITIQKSLIACLNVEIKALLEESTEILARLDKKEEENLQSRGKLETKIKALEAQLGGEPSTKAVAIQSKPDNKALEQKAKSEQPAKDKGYKLADPITDQKDLIASLNAKLKALLEQNIEIMAGLDKKEENLQSRNKWETKVKAVEAQLGGEPSTKAVAIQSKPDNKALEQKTKSEQPAKEKGFKLADPIIVRKDNLIASLNFKIKALQEENMELLDRLDKKEEESLQSRNEWETKVKALEAQLGGEPSTKAVAIQSKPNNKALEQKTKSEQPAKDKGYQLANPITIQKSLIACLNVEIKALLEESTEILARLDKKEEENLQSRGKLETKIKALEAQLGGEPSTKAVAIQSKPDNKALEQKAKSEQPAKDKGYKLADPITDQKDLIASLNAKLKALLEQNIEIMAGLDKKEENLQSRNKWETKVKAVEAQLGGEPSTKAVAIQSKPDNKALEQKTKSEQPAKEKGFKLADPIIVRKDNLIASLNFKIKALQEENMELLDRLDKKEEEIQQSKAQV